MSIQRAEKQPVWATVLDAITGRGLQREAKGMFPNETLYTGAWSSPAMLANPGTYGGSINYAVEAGDLSDNSIVMACLWWIIRNFPRSPIAVQKRTAEGLVTLPTHPLTELLAHPNTAYSGKMLWKATLLSLNLDGNGYWRKVRSGMGKTVQLWYEPHWTIRPRRTNSEDFISFYELWRNNTWERVEVEDIVHFRLGLDPRNTMYGLSQLASALREVYADNAAARYSAVLFRNMGVPGGIATPKVPGTLIDDAPGLKRDLIRATTGDAQGSWLVLSDPIEVTFPPNDPSKMDTTQARRTPEERISGLIGISAIVAGLGAGLDHSIYNNMNAAIKQSYNGNILPTQDALSEELDIQLLPEFGDNATESVFFDNSGIEALQAEDRVAREQLVVAMWDSGLLKLWEARQRVGATSDMATEDVYKYQLQTQAPAALPMPAQDSAGSATEGKGRSNGHSKARSLEASEKTLTADLEKHLVSVYKRASNGVS